MSKTTGISPSGPGTSKALILGGGFAGLWIGYQLQKEGYQIEILEQEETPGGILKTLRIDDFYFDLGPHIFLEPHVPYYKELIGEHLRRVNGFYGFGFRGKEIPSPINPPNLIRTLGTSATVPMTASMLWARLRSSFQKGAYRNVEQILCSRFGKRIYQYFFQDYVPKVTGLPCSEVSVDWFTERYRFYQEHNLWKDTIRKSVATLRTAGRTKQSDTKGLTLYYPRLGAQMVTDALLERIATKGGIVRLKAPVDRIDVSDGRVEHVWYHTSQGRAKANGDLVISTIPLPRLIDLLRPEPPEHVRNASAALTYRRLALFFCIVKRPQLSDKIQTYFPEAHYPFKRIYEPKNLDATMGTKETTGICVEVCFDTKDGATFADLADRMYKDTRQGVAHFYRIPEQAISLVATVEIPHAYAIYKIGYETCLATLAEYLLSYDHLISYGRQGSFRYNHLVDRVIDAAATVVSYIRSGGSKRAFLKQVHPKSDFF